MKKYSDEHLERVGPEFIVAAEKTVKLLEKLKCNDNTCPALIIDPNFGFPCGGDWCNSIMKFNDDTCPCYLFGSEESILLFKNLIRQWKSWAGVK